MKNLWNPPRLRVGEDSEAERHATCLELFYDLIFVAVIAQLAHNLSQDVSLSGFLGFVALFVPVWWLWVSATFYATRFDTDDPLHRLLTGIQIVAIAALAVNVPHSLGESSAGFALSYASARILLVVEYLRARRHVPATCRLTTRFIRGFGTAAAIWLVSAFVPTPLRFMFWALGLTVDFATPLGAGQLDVEFAPHTSHLPERFGLFTLIVMGESIMGVVNGVAQQQWNVLSAITLAFGLSIPFSLWWIYFDNLGGSAIQAARTCRRIWTYQIWLYTHLPLVIGLTATGVGVEHIVSRDPSLALPPPERWLICGAVALCLLALGVIYLTGRTTKILQRCQIRATYRVGAAAVILVLALAGAGLSPIELIGLIAAVCAAQILLDLRDATASS